MSIKILINIFYEPVNELKQILENNSDIYIPINGGSSLKGNDWVDKHLIFDNTDDNISDKNKILNEMTSIYWAWRNYDKIGNPDYIGHNHYRRFFNRDDFKDYKNYDLIISKPIFSSNQYSLAWQYRYYHKIEDLQLAIDVIRNRNKEFGDSMVHYMNHTGINYAPCNMFIMKKELFFKWCEFLFPILFELENKIDLTERDNYQKRALCFITERIFNFWCKRKMDSGLKIKEIAMEEHLDFKPKFINERGDFGNKIKTALVCIAKNEDNYLKEWVDYNLKIGFDDIFIHQNNWRYTKNDISDPRVHFIEFDGHRMQNKCYNDFIEKYSYKYDFAAFFDCDEFIYLKNHSNINDFLVDYKNENAIFINWRLFGDNNLTFTKGNYSVINRFTMSDNKLHPLGKNIINLKLSNGSIIFNNPHILQYKEPPLREYHSTDPNNKYKVICGCIHNNTEIESAELYHYRNKTWEENVERKYGTDDAFHEADNCDFRRDINAVKREFDNHNKNIIFNDNLVKFMETK